MNTLKTGHAQFSSGQGGELLLGPRNMGSNADLYDMEATVKQKYMDIVKNMSHLELKNFSIGKYQKLVLSELTKSLLNIDGCKLKETTQCISNALEREVKVQLKSGAR